MNSDKYVLQEVVTPALEREWLDLPKKIYKGNRNWVCPLDQDITEVFDPARNELFADGEAVRWVVRNKAGEVVAVAQSYERIGVHPQHYISRPDIDGYQIISKHKGWRNKMYVSADLMPHQIRITGIRCERLRDISDEECMKEGVVDVTYFKIGERPYELFALPGA